MRIVRLASAAAIALSTFLIASPASAATLNVCGACTYTTIKAAVTAAAPGDTIEVDTGTFNEVGPIVIDKPLTIVGEGKANTIVDGGGANAAIFEIRPLLGSAAGTITIKELTVRNSTFSTGPIRVLIKAVSTPITDITLDKLDINGGGAGYGMYADGGAKIGGVDRAAPDLTVSNSTVHGQVNNGLGIDTYRGEVTLSTNQLSEGTSGRSAILVMNEYTTSRMPDPVIIEDNTATGRMAYIKNYVGTTFGGYDDVRVTGNTVTGLEGGVTSGCPSSPTDTDCGVFFSSNTNNGASDAAMGKIEVSNNSFTGSTSPTSTGVGIAGAVAEADIHDNNMVKLGYGVRVDADLTVSPTKVTVKHNRLFNDGSGVINTSAVALDARENWWGCQTSPIVGGAYCSEAPNTGSGSVNVDPWVVTTASLGSNAILTGASTPVNVDLSHLSNGSAVALPIAYFFGRPTTFTATGGTLNPTAGTLDGSLADSSTYTAPLIAGPQTITVTVDQDGTRTGEPVELPITITALPIDNGDGDGDGNGDGGDDGGADDDTALPDTGTTTPEWMVILAGFTVLLGAVLVSTSRTRRPTGRHILS